MNSTGGRPSSSNSGEALGFAFVRRVALGAVQTYSGRHLIVREDGTVDMSAEDAEAFIRDGWTKLEEWEPGEDT